MPSISTFASVRARRQAASTFASRATASSKSTSIRRFARRTDVTFAVTYRVDAAAPRACSSSSRRRRTRRRSHTPGRRARTRTRAIGFHASTIRTRSRRRRRPSSCPRDCSRLANGALVERRDEGDRTIFRYRQDIPHSTYLVTMVAGPFVEIAQGDCRHAQQFPSSITCCPDARPTASAPSARRRA